MARVLVKPVSRQDFAMLRPTSTAMAIQDRPFGTPRRCFSSESTRVRRPRSKTCPSRANTSIGVSKEVHFDVEKILRSEVKRHFATLKQAFQTLDMFNTGTVTQSEFFQILETYCDVPLTVQQLKQLVDKVGENRDGTVSYTRFLSKFNASNRSDTPKSVEKILTDDTENQLKSKLLGEYASAVKAMKLFDYNQDGFIQKHELRRVLENFCFKLTDSQFEKLWTKYDKLHNGSMLNYMEFLDDLGARPARNQDQVRKAHGMNVAQVMTWGVQEKTPATAKKIVKTGVYKSLSSSSGSQTPERIEQLFKKKFRANYESISRAVTVLDHRACGYVSVKEFKNIMVSYTLPMSDKLFNSLLERCGITVSHRIHYDRFMDFYGEARTNILWQPEAKEEHQDIFTMLRSHINSNFSSIKDAFLEFDYNQDGKISRSELRRIVEKFSFRLSEEDYARFMSRVDPEHKGYISYQRFLEIFEVKEFVKHGHPWLNDRIKPPKNISPPAVMTWSTVEEILRNKIKDNWQSVSGAFMKIDTNKDGFLSRSELRKLLDLYCLPLSNEHFEMLWSLCDENNDGRIAFNEFLNKLGVDIISSDLHGHSTKITDESEARENFMKLDQEARLDRGPSQITAKDALGVLRNYVMQKSTDLRKMFLKFDSNNDGKISRQEFRQVLRSLGLTMTNEEFNILNNNFGFKNGTLSYQQFVKHFQLGKHAVQNSLRMQQRSTNENSHSHDVVFTAEEAEAQLRTKLQRSFSGLREAFYKFDENHDGTITRGEFRRVLKLFMITLSDREFDKLMERLHFGHDEVMNYKAFLERFERQENIDSHLWLMARSKVRSARSVGYIGANEADEIIKKKAMEHWSDLSKAFRNFDQDGNGLVTKNELKNILYRYQLALTQEEFDKLWQRYDTDGNGFVDYKEFIAKLGVEFSPGDVDGHSRRIIEESYDTTMNPQRRELLSPSSPKQVVKFEESPMVSSAELQRLTTMEIEKRLREVVIARFYTFVKAFVDCDVEHSGCVSRSAFHKIINDHGFRLSEHHLNQIWNTLPQNPDGTIQYNKFLTLYSDNRDAMRHHHHGTPDNATESHHKSHLHSRARSAPMTSSRRRSVSPTDRFPVARKLTPPEKVTQVKVMTPPGQTKDVEYKIKEKVNHEKCLDLEEAFIRQDPHKTGSISLQQFKDVLFDCNIPLTPDEVRTIWRKYDVYNTGSIFYMEFLRSFAEDRIQQSNEKFLYRSKLQPTRIPYSPGTKTEQLMTLKSRIHKQICGDWRSMRRSFRALDQQGNGTCSTLAFRHVLRKYNIELSEDEFYHLSSYYDKNLNGRIPYNEFLAVYLD